MTETLQEIIERLKKDKTIRPFTSSESNVFYGAIVRATNIDFVPSFRDVFAIMRPFYDGTAETIYTDKFSRVGVGAWFFTLTPDQRATAVIHEAMHVLNNHFSRGEKLSGDPTLKNIAGDYEINSSISTLPKADISMGVMPEDENFARFLSFEKYLDKLNKKYGNKNDNGSTPPSPQDGLSSDPASNDESQSEETFGNGESSSETSSQENSQNDSNSETGSESLDSQGSENNSDSNGEGESQNNDDNADSSDSSEGSSSSNGQSKPGKNKAHCTEVTPERTAKIDELGIDKASPEEIVIAKENTKSRIKDHLSRKTTSGFDGFLNSVIENMKEPQVDWRIIFRKTLTNFSSQIATGSVTSSYRRPSRRYPHSEFIFPGLIGHKVRLMTGVDVSGSMDEGDYSVIFSEIDSFLTTMRNKIDKHEIFPVSTSVGNVKHVKNFKDINLESGGGTDMNVAFKYINSLPANKRPNLFVLMTDGEFYGNAWEDIYKSITSKEGRTYKTIILISSRGTFKNVPLKVREKASVIDISLDE